MQLRNKKIKEISIQDERYDSDEEEDAIFIEGKRKAMEKNFKYYKRNHCFKPLIGMAIKVKWNDGWATFFVKDMVPGRMLIYICKDSKSVWVDYLETAWYPVENPAEDLNLEVPSPTQKLVVEELTEIQLLEEIKESCRLNIELAIKNMNSNRPKPNLEPDNTEPPEVETDYYEGTVSIDLFATSQEETTKEEPGTEIQEVENVADDLPTGKTCGEEPEVEQVPKKGHKSQLDKNSETQKSRKEGKNNTDPNPRGNNKKNQTQENKRLNCLVADCETTRLQNPE